MSDELNVESEAVETEVTETVETKPDSKVDVEKEKALALRGKAREYGFNSVKEMTAFIESAKAKLEQKPEDNPEIIRYKKELESRDAILSDVYSKISESAEKDFIEIFNENNPDIEDMDVVSKIKTFNKEYAYFQRMKAKAVPAVELKKEEAKKPAKPAAPGVSKPSQPSESVDMQALIAAAMKPFSTQEDIDKLRKAMGSKK